MDAEKTLCEETLAGTPESRESKRIGHIERKTKWQTKQQNSDLKPIQVTVYNSNRLGYSNNVL